MIVLPTKDALRHMRTERDGVVDAYGPEDRCVRELAGVPVLALHVELEGEVAVDRDVDAAAVVVDDGVIPDIADVQRKVDVSRADQEVTVGAKAVKRDS